MGRWSTTVVAGTSRSNSTRTRPPAAVGRSGTRATARVARPSGHVSTCSRSSTEASTSNPHTRRLPATCTSGSRAIEPTVRSSTYDSYSRNARNHVIPHIGNVRLTKVDAGVLNGLYAVLLASGRRLPSRTGKGYSSEVLERAQELRAEGKSLAAAAEVLCGEFDEAAHITKDTLASLLRRATRHDAAARSPGLDPRTVSYIHTILHSRGSRTRSAGDDWRATPADAADPPRGGPKSDGSTPGMPRRCARSSTRLGRRVIGTTHSG